MSESTLLASAESLANPPPWALQVAPGFAVWVRVRPNAWRRFWAWVLLGWFWYPSDPGA